jgi:nucleotide-binding universal stress UspA family protein
MAAGHGSSAVSATRASAGVAPRLEAAYFRGGWIRSNYGSPPDPPPRQSSPWQTSSQSSSASTARTAPRAQSAQRPSCSRKRTSGSCTSGTCRTCTPPATPAHPRSRRTSSTMSGRPPKTRRTTHEHGKDLAGQVGLETEGVAYVTSATPWRQLLGSAQDAKAKLIVVGSRGRGGVKSLVLGSTSQALAHHSRLPLLIVPDRSEE